MVVCKRKDRFNPDTSHVCSDHFAAADFKSDLRSEVMNIRTKKILKPGIIPHENLPRSSLAEGSRKTEAGRKGKQRLEERSMKKV